MYRPLVITSVFTGNITDGHGHHQVSGEVAQEVFKAAGDPNVFPDQIAAGLRPWSPLKVYARVPFSIGGDGAQDDFRLRDGQVVAAASSRLRDQTVDATMFRRRTSRFPKEPSIRCWAARTFRCRAKAGASRSRRTAAAIFRFRGLQCRLSSLWIARCRPRTRRQSFFDGIDTSLPGIAALAHGDAAFLTDGSQRHRSPCHDGDLRIFAVDPEKIAPELAIGYSKTKD